MKYSPKVISKNSQSPISLSQFQNVNTNVNVNINTELNLNLNGNQHTMVPMRLTPTHHQHEGGMTFNQEIGKKHHAKHSSGGINFAALNERRN